MVKHYVRYFYPTGENFEYKDFVVSSRNVEDLVLPSRFITIFTFFDREIKNGRELEGEINEQTYYIGHFIPAKEVELKYGRNSEEFLNISRMDYAGIILAFPWKLGIRAEEVCNVCDPSTLRYEESEAE